jgi:DNA-binding response OmpR family regulator
MEPFFQEFSEPAHGWSNSLQSTSSDTRDAQASRIKRVLLFDSDADTADMYAVGLGVEGFASAIVAETATAIEHIRSEQPDAIVVEVTEAARNDWHFVRWCRAGGVARRVPVVLLAGHPHARMPAAPELECMALLMKPLLPETLAQVIRALLADDDASPTSDHPSA